MSITVYPKSFHSINCKGKLIDLSRPKIMGILNLTPDSFSDGGKFNSEKEALIQTEKMISQGASFIDIGPQSTRPNAEKISAQEEIQRLGRIISCIKKEFPDTLVSLDTFYAEVVEFGFNEGIDVINDISGGQYDPKMFEMAGQTKLPYVLMHTNETYQTMHEKKENSSILVEIQRFFSEKIHALRQYGVTDILLDPGFGFGKTIEQQYEILESAELFGYGREALFIGISRKSFIYKPLGLQPHEVNEETQKLHLKMLEKGARILRVHDVAEAKKTVDLFLQNIESA